ncbi:MAG: hypothetical protein LUE31_06460 [Lachnospiraceae bacterium]|nr:hypothetical protein [Lachnospiraceae bacterium]
MYSYHFTEWLALFYFYCIFGWCFESAYVSLKEHRPVNRGFMKGPWLPLYGSGAVLILWLTLPFQETPALVFLIGAAGATVLEYVTGVVMLRLFKVRYWDYSNQRFQFQGYICLTSTIAWGLLSLLMVYVVHEPVAGVVLGLPEDVSSVLTFAVTVLVAYDFRCALKDALDLRDLLIKAEQLRAEAEQRLEEKKRVLEAAATFTEAAARESIAERREELADRMERSAMQLQEKREQIMGRVERSAMELQEKKEQLTDRMGKSSAEQQEKKAQRTERTEWEFAELRERGERLMQRLEKSTEQLRRRNPSLRPELPEISIEELRERIRKLREK